MDLIHSLSSMFLHMYNLLYDLFVICLSLFAFCGCWPGDLVILTPLPDRDLTQKLHNKLSNVHNNNNNVLEYFRKMHQLYTRRTA